MSLHRYILFVEWMPQVPLPLTTVMVTAGEKGEGRTTFKPLHYMGTPIHRIVKGFIIQGGDFSEGKTIHTWTNLQ